MTTLQASITNSGSPGTDPLFVDKQVTRKILIDKITKNDEFLLGFMVIRTDNNHIIAASSGRFHWKHSSAAKGKIYRDLTAKCVLTGMTQEESVSFVNQMFKEDLLKVVNITDYMNEREKKTQSLIDSSVESALEKPRQEIQSLSQDNESIRLQYAKVLNITDSLLKSCPQDVADKAEQEIAAIENGR